MSGPAWPPAGTRPLAVDVVSVQSQVIYGRVGNNVAVPALRQHGLTVAAVPTVLLSNTPHYSSLHGGAVRLDWFRGWLDDLVARGSLKQAGAILTGYLGSAAQAGVLAHWIRQRLACQPGLAVVIDPVIGDHDQGVYVDPALVEVHRRQLSGLADGLTPNSFELGHLVQQPVPDLRSTVAAARRLLQGRTRWVVATSAAPETWEDGRMQLVLVEKDRARLIHHPRIESSVKGTGDLFNAGLMARWLRGQSLLEASIGSCGYLLQALRETRRQHCAELQLPVPTAAADGSGREIRVEELPF